MKEHNNMQNKMRRFKRTLKGKQGVTLVELIVTFALIGLFAAGCTQMIAVSIKTYHQIRGLNYAKQVSDTLLDKISGEIAGAQVGTVQGTDGGLHRTLKIYENGKVIEFYDKTGSHISITSTSNKSLIRPDTQSRVDEYQTNQLLLYYYPVQWDNASTEDEYKFKGVDWTYDKAVYMGFEIEELKFTLAGADYPLNIVKVELTLKSVKYGTHKSTRYVECYNFITQQDLDKISEE